MVRFLRWWKGDGEAKKRIKRWISEGRITGRGDVSDLIGLLRWLADRSAGARALMRASAYVDAAESYEWPDVDLPEQAPTIDGVS